MDCYICKGLRGVADKYTWCRVCIRHAAKGAASYTLTHSTRPLGRDLSWELKRLTNYYQRRFKKKLRGIHVPSCATT